MVPDFDSSPEVLTWTWMFRGVSERSGWEEMRAERPASSWAAFFMLSTEDTQKRFGIEEARGLHLSRKMSVSLLLSSGSRITQ